MFPFQTSDHTAQSICRPNLRPTTVKVCQPSVVTIYRYRYNQNVISATIIYQETAGLSNLPYTQSILKFSA